MSDFPQTSGIHVVALRGATHQTVGFVEGFHCLLRGMRFVYRDHRALAKVYLWPMALSFLIIAGTWLFFFLSGDDLVQGIWAEPSTDKWRGILHFLWRITSVLIWIAVGYLLMIFFVFIYSVAAAPFGDLLSEQTEGILGTWQARDFSFRFLVADLGQTVKLELVRFGHKLIWLLPLFVLSLLVPVVGQLIYVTVGGYLLSKNLGMDYIDWCAARREWPWRERMAFARKHRGALVGFGAGVMLSYMVPLLFVFVWPGAVAGGALLFTDLRRKEGAGNVHGRSCDDSEI